MSLVRSAPASCKCCRDFLLTLCSCDHVRSTAFTAIAHLYSNRGGDYRTLKQLLAKDDWHSFAGLQGQWENMVQPTNLHAHMLFVTELRKVFFKKCETLSYRHFHRCVCRETLAETSLCRQSCNMTPSYGCACRYTFAGKSCWRHSCRSFSKFFL